MLVTSICPARVLPLQAPFTFSSGNVHSSIVITIRPDQTSARYSSRSFCHRAMNEVSNVRPNREWCAMTFRSDRGYDVRPRGEIAAKKKRIDLTLRKLWRLIAQSGFHRNVKFATFEEAGRLCRTIPQNGVKVAPLGGRSVPSCPIDFLWCRT